MLKNEFLAIDIHNEYVHSQDDLLFHTTINGTFHFDFHLN
jgi:hypothetical protein